MRPRRSAYDRLLDRLAAPTATGCREFTGSRNMKGYGQIGVREEDDRLHIRSTHRVTWIALNGPVPEGLFVCHRCDNPPCCEISHLFLATNAENMADMAAKGRSGRWEAYKTHCKRGHEFTPANTYVTPRGHRTCRTCKNDRWLINYRLRKWAKR